MSAIAESTLTLCSTARLARKLYQAQIQQFIQSGALQWQAPQVQTLQQWLQSYTSFAMLAGEVPATYFTPNVLDSFTESMFWQQAIESCLAKHAYAALFDVPSLAKAAIAANQMLINWQIADADIQAHFTNAETQQFLRWRNAFFKLCEQHQTVTPAWRLQQQIDAVALSTYPIPKHITLAGFDRVTPLEQKLIHILQAKGVQIERHQIAVANPKVVQAGFLDLHAECRAAVAWAKQQLAQNPNAQLAIISPVQSNVRRVLSDLLDDTFHTEALLPNLYETPRIYDFSVGLMLNEQAMCRTSLRLLRLCSSRIATSQADLSALLLDVYWSALHEHDARCIADARMRKQLIRTLSLPQLLALTRDNAALTQLNLHLNYMLAAQSEWTASRLPSAWSQAFTTLLAQVNWSQTHPLSSHEYQAKQAWDKLLLAFAALDKLTGNITAQDAVQKLQQLARNHMFMPEATGDVHIQLLGMLENLEQPIDGIWVMGTNDHLWPPATDLNPLLPATLQRQLQTPGATPDAQAAFAQNIHTRLCNSAKEVLFSWSHQDGDRELRVSPLLANIPSTSWDVLAPSLAETLAQPQSLKMLDDSMAPPYLASENLKGGSQLIAAQAVCPAWAYYQYRLGAKALEEPSNGLDSMTRGNLVHAVLQYFWLACKDATTLKQLDDSALNHMVHQAIEQALVPLKHDLPDQLIKLEHHRLNLLIHSWLSLEKQRDDFRVDACEAQYAIQIAGLDIVCRIDRIDALEDGSLVIIDYKTGASDPKMSSWTDARIKEPQLPLYASIVLKDQHVVAVCFAKVNAQESKFTGVADTEGIPNITSFDQLKSNSAFKAFEHMPALVAHWHSSLTQLAQEIVHGVASVQFEDENDLMYCEVKPLLRLPERQLQYEMQQTALPNSGAVI
ncbi:MAG: PD-(D/E)XK nuclease family protein [Methylophilus sp.]|nr:PD-(D/E)XK nuclease family protein [Methylophilus sp.]